MANDSEKETDDVVPWRLRAEWGQPYLRAVPLNAYPITSPDLGAAVVLDDGAVDWQSNGVDSSILFSVCAAFLVTVEIGGLLWAPCPCNTSNATSGVIAVEYADIVNGPWFRIAEVRIKSDNTALKMQWPDVGYHDFWRLIVVVGPACQFSNVTLWERQFQVRLTDPSNFKRIHEESELYKQLPAEARPLVSKGCLVEGNCELLAQLYHESDLLGWGSEIKFPCFMTLWAKEATSHDFASLVHRFTRYRTPLLILSGTHKADREELWVMLKSLLQPQFADWVVGIHDPQQIVDELWRCYHAGQVLEVPPRSLDEVNSRLQVAYERLGIPTHLRQEGYTCQFHKHDPLMLLLTKEVFGTWAPNRVFQEVEGHDIFRTYATFSCVDGIVCSDDAVWMHQPSDFYMPCGDSKLGDKRSPEFLQLLECQKPYLSSLLQEYEQKELVTKSFREDLERGLFSNVF